MRLFAFGFILLGCFLAYLILHELYSLWIISILWLMYSFAQIIITEYKIMEFKLKDTKNEL